MIRPHRDDMSRSRAFGKVILFGEHAVVYGQPALAVPVNQVYAQAEVSEIDRAGIWVDAPDIGLRAALSRLARDHPLASVIYGVFAALGMSASASSLSGIRIQIKSTIPIASGLGSGAAVSVAIIRALSAHLGRLLEDEQVSEIAYEVEKIHHGTPSGIDNTVVTYGKPVFFLKSAERGAQIESLRVAKPFTLLIADTGIPAPTKESVGDVRKLWRQNPRKMEALFAAAGSIARAARLAIEGGYPERLGALMNENQRILQEMTVSSAKLDALTEAALKAGALGAKLSGGGRGGNMIALVNSDLAETVARSLREAGAKRVIITTVI